MNPNIHELIEALDTEDRLQQRQASEELKALGLPALLPLAEALRSGSPPVRKAAAYLLGTARTPGEGIQALSAAVLEDPIPKVRQNAAVSLGKIDSPSGVSALIAALETEEAGFVRVSLLLALGALGGEHACQALREFTPLSDPEREAHRKALNRCADVLDQVDWNRENAGELQFLLEAPPGLEEVAQEEAAEHGIPLERRSPGFLSAPVGTLPWDLFPCLRTVYGLAILAGEGPSLPLDDLETTGKIVARMIAQSRVLAAWRDWLQTDSAPLRYRFSLGNKKIGRENARALVQVVREACQPLGWEDNPSHYEMELRVVDTKEESLLLLRPVFMEDDRFSYRKRDVGASLHPVLAAGLARLARTGDRGVVFDPTCGSGTLLIERAFLDEPIRFIGVDISPTAVEAARTNVQAAGLEDRIKLLQADASRKEAWPDCEEVIANLPFGIRTRHQEMDLDRLYLKAMDHLSESLVKGGKAVLFTANKSLMEAVLAEHKREFWQQNRYKILSGGLWAYAWVLIRR